MPIADDVPATEARFLAGVGAPAAAVVEAGSAEEAVVVAAGGAEAAVVDGSRISPSSTGDEAGRVAATAEGGLDMTDR